MYYDGAVNDLPRLLGAACVALSMTLAALSVAALSGRARLALGAPAVAWVLAAAALVNRGVTSWWVPLAASLAALSSLLVPAGRAALRAVPAGASLAAQALALSGLARLAAERAGWLPPSFARASVGVDVACAVAAIAAWRWPGRASRWVVAVGALGVARVAAEVAMQEAWVRPLPEFEALWRCAAGPLFVLAALPALARGAGQR